ncbi:MAG TPA: pitrilysin family protein [Anaerohalosphaeraceae bacterium]|nr:pitrilysin family protein [Anaerohalosphaeraceae bacterium]HQG05751.1 pitrilysin family protein [Anaerohalosphaeraceae bacterium]HQI07124.1 pitrilysin family protein [Anaerohalosphaeraceae bacterium]HQJ66946.1 pitrilysin family protein [Anaerohalosphaeraceae bacterium]
MHFQQTQLKNGLTIIGEVSPTAQSAAVGFFVRTGSRDENSQISGVSHFLEHMLFKGTDGLSALEVNEAFDRLGAKFNAFTSEENTVYYAAVLPEYFPQVVELWCQLMRPALRQEDFDVEKQVILEEIAMYKDLPTFEVFDRARQLHFGSHPCANSVLGTEESIRALTAEQMRSYFAKRYAPNNVVAVCCGQFDFGQTCRLIEDLCASWQPNEAPRLLADFRGTAQKQRKTKEGLTGEHICLMSSSVSMQDPRRYAASLLSLIVGDKSGSRYFWALVDPAIADTATMQYEAMDGVGIFASYFHCRLENREKVLRITQDIFDELLAKGVTEQELNTAKNKALSALTIESERPMGRLVSLGFNWAYLKTYRSVSEDVQAVKAITADQINELIREHPFQNYTEFSLGPAEP